MNHHNQYNNSRPTTSGSGLTGMAMSGVGPTGTAGATTTTTTTTTTATPGVAVLRGRGPPNVKKKRKCIEIVCEPCVIFLVTTIIITALASALLSMALTSRYWEMMIYDQEKLQRLFFENTTNNLSVKWLFDGRVPRITGTTGGMVVREDRGSSSSGSGAVTSRTQTVEDQTATATANFMAKVNSFGSQQQQQQQGKNSNRKTKNQEPDLAENVHSRSSTSKSNNNNNNNNRNDDNYAFSTHPDETDVSSNFVYSTQDNLVFLLPLHSGVWISCIDLTEQEFTELRTVGYDNNVHCVDHLNPDTTRKPTDARASWQHRMQNLAIACAMVCLILLGAAVVVGLFGILRRQISAVLVTGVLYALAAIFAIFTLTIVHLKHKNRQERDPLDVWTRLTPDYTDFRSARIISHGWSLSLAWGGCFICILASIMWILLSKIMRYNPLSLRS